MNQLERDEIEKLVIDEQGICHCPGPTCSGCEKMIRKLILKGAEAAFKLRDEDSYCTVCGSCGEDGCCAAERCKYPDLKSETIKELKAELTAYDEREAMLVARLVATIAEHCKLKGEA